MNIAIIGSGLAAVSTAKFLINRGVKPIILDVGETLGPEKSALIKKMSSVKPEQWNDYERKLVTSNPTVFNKNSFPLKLAFGSDYFYGKSSTSAPVESVDVLPPFSYAKGGFSVGWGAVVQPPDNCDLNGWPVNNSKLNQYYEQILSGLPYSAIDDGLTQNFPVWSSNPDPLPLTRGNESLLNDLKNASLLLKDSIVFGQSRLLVRTSAFNDGVGCQQCGCCMSGCVYGCIYKSNHDIDRLVGRNSIEYVSGVQVQTVQEVGKKINVSLINKHGSYETLSFDRVFLAAGALNSTRIILQSKKIYKTKTLLKSTVGFVAPMLRIKRSPIDWPNANTQPGLFLEYKVADLSNHWVHTQLSTPNELVFEKLKIDPNVNGFLQRVKKCLAEHLIIALCNMHSNHGNGYEIELVKSTSGGSDKLISNRQQLVKTRRAINKAKWRLFSIGRKIGCYPIIPFIQDSAQEGGYHVGGSLPMRNVPKEETDTNTYGNPKGYTRLHVVDSSILPSLPGTTIGLLAMANAARIASEVELK